MIENLNSMQFMIVNLKSLEGAGNNLPLPPLPPPPTPSIKLSSHCFCSECTKIKTSLEDDELNP